MNLRKVQTSNVCQIKIYFSRDQRCFVDSVKKYNLRLFFTEIANPKASPKTTNGRTDERKIKQQRT